MKKSEIADDLGRHLQEQVGALLERHIRVAKLACGATDLSIMLLELAASVNLTVAGTIAAYSDNADVAASMFDHTLEAINAAGVGSRARALALVAEAKAAKAAQA